MVEADLVDDDTRRLDAVRPGPPALEADRDVAEADRAVAVVEQRARDDADGVREVDDPRVRRPADSLGDLEHDGDGAERLRETARARRLLPDAATGERERLVRQARRLAADADLDQDEVGAVDRAVQVVGDLQRAGVALPVE